MGNLKIEGMEKLEAKKLDLNDPKVKEIIEQSIKEQERILKLHPELLRLRLQLYEI